MSDNWDDKTVVGFVIEKTKDGSTRVFQVRTQSSHYVLGFFGLGGPRPFAMMRGLSQGIGHEIDLRDSAPRIGEHSLFDVPVEQWVGQRIDMAGTKTSSVVAALEEKNPVHTDTLVRTLMQPATRQPATQTNPPEQPKREQRRQTPYPENLIEYVEALASALRYLASEGSALDEIVRRSNLVARLKVALMNAHVASEDIVLRLGSAR